MRTVTTNLLLAPALSLAACNENTADARRPKAAPAGGKVASCNYIKSESLCRQWGAGNLEVAGEEMLQKMCKENHQGEYKKEPCPTAKRVGSCATPEGTKMYYNEGPLPLAADQAAKSCKEGMPAGTWTTGV